MKNKNFVTLLLAVCIAIFAQVSFASDILRLATTTSTENSGLIKNIIPVFEKKFSISVHTIAGGTGRALNFAKNGDVDVVLVHAKKAELEFVENGFGVNRQEIMYNEFVIVGPKNDTAKINGLKKLSEAFSAIALSESPFVSRGDDSGTHKREIEVWQQAKIQPTGSWYKEVGLGMGRALQIADELDAYILTDKGTWLFLKDKLSLELHVEGAKDGHNVYGIIAVNPQKHSQVNFKSAQRLIQWLQSAEARTLITSYKVGNEQLFYVID